QPPSAGGAGTAGAPSPIPPGPTGPPGTTGGTTPSVGPATGTCTTTLSDDQTITAIFQKPSLGGEGGPSFAVNIGVKVQVFASPSTTSVAGTITSNPGGLKCTNRDSLN